MESQHETFFTINCSLLETSKLGQKNKARVPKNVRGISSKQSNNSHRPQYEWNGLEPYELWTRGLRLTRFLGRGFAGRDARLNVRYGRGWGPRVSVRLSLRCRRRLRRRLWDSSERSSGGSSEFKDVDGEKGSRGDKAAAGSALLGLRRISGVVLVSAMLLSSPD